MHAIAHGAGRNNSGLGEMHDYVAVIVGAGNGNQPDLFTIEEK
jgi:hypothetical protein